MENPRISKAMSAIEKKSVFNSTLLIYTLAAALLFTAGFFIHFGQEAKASKTWGYVMSDGDDLTYWTIAKGRTMTPRCDGNPYYYEEQGTRHIIPFTTAEIIGLVSKYTGISLSWFFPAWYILMPFFVWIVIVVSCWKLWDYSLEVSAAGAMILLSAAPLFYPWNPIPNIFFRFSRPMDGIAPLFLWISLLFKGDPGNKKHCVAIVLVSSLALWLHPYYAVFGMWITVLEYLYALYCKEGFLKAKLHLYAMGSCFVSGLFFAGYAFLGKNTNPMLMQIHSSGGLPALSFLMAFLMFVFVASVVLFFVFNLKKKITALDRLVMEWTFFGAFIFSFLKPVGQAATHLLYFFLIMIFSLTGWTYEKLAVLKENHGSLLNKAAGLVFAVFLGFFMISRKDFLEKHAGFYFVLIPLYFFALFFPVWAIVRFDFLKRWVMRKYIAIGIILLLAVGGYWRTCQDSLNRDFPFDGAYQWLTQHAQKGAVVLTATLRYEDRDYLPLKTGLKSYYSYHGLPWDDGSPNAFRHAYRNLFRLGLFLNALDKMPSYEGWSLDQKIHALKLDYILIPKPSPFFDAITNQLAGRLQPVYQDEWCLIWKVL